MTHRVFCFYALFWMVLAWQHPVMAQAFLRYGDAATICPGDAGGDNTGVPDFDAPDCRTVSMAEIDPQGRMVWVKTALMLDRIKDGKGAPLAVFISAKMSSEVYLNGTYIGRNGLPGYGKTDEAPGVMDAVFHAPQSLFRAGRNDIVLRLSSHHGYLRLSHPVHRIAIGPAGPPMAPFLRYYWPSLITFGAFVVGGLYFGITAIRGRDRGNALMLCLISLFAAGQLLTEVSRGLVPYLYPFHDIRLILIVLFSMGFGVCVAGHALGKYMARPSGEYTPVMLLGLGLAVASAVGILQPDGFDQKAAAAMLMPILICVPALVFWTLKRRHGALRHLLAFLAFILIILSFPDHFLDTVFFYSVAAFLTFLVAEQALAFAREEDRRSQGEARANKLEMALEQARARTDTPQITINSAGKIDRVPADQITDCHGAGGYVEIRLADGGALLHSASLAELEESLPATFLRVHRSHLVNTAYVRTLEREPAGTGRLILASGISVPVSRRVMPKVRLALK